MRSRYYLVQGLSDVEEGTFGVVRANIVHMRYVLKIVSRWERIQCTLVGVAQIQFV